MRMQYPKVYGEGGRCWGNEVMSPRPAGTLYKEVGDSQNTVRRHVHSICVL